MARQLIFECEFEQIIINLMENKKSLLLSIISYDGIESLYSCYLTKLNKVPLLFMKFL